MFYRHEYSALSPITYIGKIPVFSVTILVAVFVSGAVLARVGLFPDWMSLISLTSSWFDASPLHNVFGALLIYTALTVGSPITLWWVLDMIFLYIFGKELEQHLGHRLFILVYLALYFIAPVVGLGLSFAFGGGQALSGWFILASFLALNNPANLAVFVAFAAVYPNAQLLGGVPAKFWAWGLIAFELLNVHSIYSGGMQMQVVQAVGILNSFNILAIAAISSFFLAWFLMRGRYQLEAALETVPRPNLFKSRFGKGRARIIERDANTDPHSIIDPLLEKISRTGLSSLTSAERQSLDNARADLMRRNRNL